MEPRWLVLYTDGSTFDYSMGEPKDAPGNHVQFIIQESDMPGENAYLVHQSDYYIWMGKTWMGVDDWGFKNYIILDKHPFEKAALAGIHISNTEYNSLYKVAKEIRDRWTYGSSHV